MGTRPFRTGKLRDNTGRAIGEIRVVAASPSNVTVATLANGSTVDGATVATGDYVLLPNQTDPTEIGVYWIRATGPAIRSLLMKAGSNAAGARVYVERGNTYADQVFRCTNNSGSATVESGTDVLDFVTDGCCTAAQTGYTPSGTDDWPGTSDPDDVAEALDKLVARLAVLEASPGATDASAVTYTPGTDTDWAGSTDPGNVDDALDQLAGRVSVLEDTPAVSDAADVTYTPGTDSDWSGTADPGNVDDALDQLAGRVKVLEDSPAGSADASTTTFTPGTDTDWSGSVDPGNVDDALDQLASRVKYLEQNGGGGGGPVDASVVTYTPGTDADWSGTLDPGDVDDALDQLAGRVAALENTTPVSLPGLQFLLYNTETASSEHNTSTAESSALGSYTLPANSYDYIKIEAIIRLRAEEDAASKSDFTIRFYEGATLRRTYTARIIENSTAGIDSGGRMTTTLSTVITGGQGSSSALTVTVQPSRSNANIGALCEAFRVYGIKDEALEAVQGPQGPAGTDGGVITVLPIAVPTALTALALSGGASIVTDENGGRRLIVPDDTPNWKVHGEYEAVPGSAPWEKRLLLSWPHAPTASELAGIMVRHSDGRLLTFGIHANPTPYYYGSAWTDENTIGSSFLSNGITDAVWRVGWLWFHVGDDNAGNLYWGVSKDGKSIGPSTGTSLPGYTSIAKASYFDPDYVGWFGSSNGGGLMHYTNQAWETVP